ncbi:MAG TPA: hypothetical protein VJ989_05630 [Solirubrobacterales bacterium]|nr:hypothetical protein [Solirubrobacterales bacterium]
MSVEGLRAWIAEVERKLGKRTRVFLALTVIAIGIAGASLYLAIDARNSSVSESDVQALQQKLETRIDEVAAGGAATAPIVPPVETEPTPAPQPEESKPKSEGGKKNGSGTSGGASSGSTGSATGGAADSTQIQELIEQAKKKQAEAGGGQNSP